MNTNINLNKVKSIKGVKNNKLHCIKNQTDTTDTISKPTTNKDYLQNLLKDFIKDNDTDKLYQLARIIVKKTMINYAKTSDDGFYLYKCSKNPNTTNQDIKDLKQTCLLSIIESLTTNTDTNKIIKKAYNDVNNYLYHQRSIRISNKSYDYSIEELEENGVHLVNIRKGVTQFFKEDAYNMYELETDNQTRLNQQKTILKVLRELTPLQKQVAKLLALGYSERQIGNKLNRSNITIHEHIKAIRNKANKIKFDN